MKTLVAIVMLAATNLVSAQTFQGTFPGIGRAATKAEVAAWDIDVRPDFKGLPKGKGSVAKGMEVWDTKCASCHGTFGESNEVFNPIIGGTSRDDINTGRVANLMPGKAYPQRTTMMKLSSLSTMWDYINRAMPWTQPKSLSVEEVYAVTAYILNMADVVPDHFVLSHENIQSVQNMLPNRHGKTQAHGLWPGNEFAKQGGTRSVDVKGSQCQSNCATPAKVASLIPDYARNAHGNLAEQNRGVGPQRGQITQTATAKMTAPSQAAAPAQHVERLSGLINKNACSACHGMENQMIGPSFRAIAKKYGEKADNQAYVSSKVRQGGAGVWGQISMPAQNISEDDATLIAQWLMSGAPSLK